MEMKKYRWGYVKKRIGETGNLVGNGNFAERPYIDPEVQDDEGHAVMIDDQVVYLPTGAIITGVIEDLPFTVLHFLVPDEDIKINE